MLKTIAKLTAVAMLALGLASCDNKDDTKPELPKPDSKPSITQPAPLQGLYVSLQTSKIAFELPPGFSIQTQYSGNVNPSKSAIQLFLDSKSRQRTVTSEVIPPDDMKLNTSDEMLRELTQSMLTELADRYKNIRTTKELNFIVGKQKLRRVDTEQSVNGLKMISTILLTVANKQVVTLQMLTPANAPEEHEALVQRIIDTLALK